MRIPIPNNRLVALTLAGAVLTALVAGGLAFPGIGIAGLQDSSDAASNVMDGQQTAADTPTATAGDGSTATGSGAPTPNQEFTPAVQTQSGGEYEEEHEEDEQYEEEHEEDEDEHE